MTADLRDRNSVDWRTKGQEEIEEIIMGWTLNGLYVTYNSKL